MKLLDDFFHLFFPRLCEACTSALYEGEELVCLRCRRLLPETHFYRDPHNNVARLFWGRVQLERAASVYFFNKGARIQHLLHSLKYRNRPDIGVLLGRWMGEAALKEHWLTGFDAVVPVPLHPKKQKRRGYNQAAMVARGIAAVSGLPLHEDWLLKVQNNASQTRKSRSARWENVKSSFSLSANSELQGKHILLIDDVITTGATLEACAAVMKEQAQCRVSVLSVACAFQ